MRLSSNKIVKGCLILMAVLLLLIGTAALAEKGLKKESGISPEAFLKLYNLKVQNNPVKFKIDVPKDWSVAAGQYPEGLYWKLANEFSKDAGFDLTKLKGSQVEVWRYSLTGGLPGTGSQSNFSYPSTVVLLVRSGKVKGAWLNFNMQEIGPSVKKRYLEDITGLTFEEWVQKEGVFSNTGKNSDLTGLEPVDLIKVYFKAINDGDKIRANACLTPDEMLNALTMNLGGNNLYNTGFGQENSLTENILKVEPISFRFMDPSNFAEFKLIGSRTEIEVDVKVNIKWRGSEKVSPDGIQDRFIIMKKYSYGWKLEGFGTGP